MDNRIINEWDLTSRRIYIYIYIIKLYKCNIYKTLENLDKSSKI